MTERKKKALIAMSGGVDSSVAAYIMKEKGYDLIGATMKLFNGYTDFEKPNSCCSLSDVEDAKSVAYKLEFPHYVFNFKDKFSECVIDKFVYAYEHGLTPNPCIDCNRYLKFEKLFDRAMELKADLVVTGHYARIEYDEQSGRYLLKKAVDLNKDQSYVLYSLTQDQLKHTEFPLGSFTKPEVRKIAEKCGFINASKHDSQDICFVQDGKYSDFIENYTKKTYPPGDFIDKSGKILGKHSGIIRYTIGQRKGLGISGGRPLYVIKINPSDNTVILGDEKDLYTDSLIVTDINLISTESIKAPMRVQVKVRYSQNAADALAVQTDKNTIRITFDNPQRAVTSGQAAVLYDGDTVVGGGTIL